MHLIFALVLMVITGYFDGLAFGRAPGIWNHHGSDRAIEIAKTLTLFLLGLITYISATYFLHQKGIENAFIVTLVWFVVTIVSMAIFSGSFFTLSLTDKLIALSAVFFIALLYVRGVGE
jgi:hypothetical protein